MRVARLLIYEGDEKPLDEQLGRSMNDGIRKGSYGVTIRCMTLKPAFLSFCEALGQQLIEETYLQGERVPPPIYQRQPEAPPPPALEPPVPAWKLYRRLDGTMQDAVPAIQWTGENLQAVQAFMLPDSPLSPHRLGTALGIRLPDDSGGLAWAELQSWIVKEPVGCAVYLQGVFADTFEPIPFAGVLKEPTKGDIIRAISREQGLPVREYVDGIDIAAGATGRAADIVWKCPSCNARGFAPRTGTRASGETFEGCEYCTNDGSHRVLEPDPRD